MRMRKIWLTCAALTVCALFGAPALSADLGPEQSRWVKLTPQEMSNYQFEKKHCDKGDAGICAFLAMDMLNQGKPVRDDVLARKLLSRACEGRWLPACYELAKLNQSGRGGSIDLPMARQLYAKACDQDVHVSGFGCYEAATMFQQGVGGLPSRETAELFFARACARSDRRACSMVHDNSVLLPAYKYACDGGYKDACSHLTARATSVPAASQDAWVGCYAMRGDTQPDFKITKEAGQYRWTMRYQGRWSKSDKALRPATAEELASKFGSDASKVQSSLRFPGELAFGIYRIPAGAVIAGNRIDEGYYFHVLGSKGAAAYRLSCP